MKKENLILLTIFALLVIGPLMLNTSAEYGGTDGKASDLALELNPDYEPWFEPFWTPPSSEIESLLFTLFAVCGAITIGYFIGVHKGKPL